MAVNGLTSSNSVNLNQVNASYESVSISAEITKTSVTATSANSDAAVYEKSKDSDKVAQEHKVDQETIDRLMAEAEERQANLRGLVEKLLLKQGGTFDLSKGLASVFRNLEPDAETIEQAQKDIAEDGYWGVEQTSDRILDFAKALAGDNLDMAEKMLDAIKEGFRQAGVEWGEDLPEISQKTMEATYSKVNDWISSLRGDSGTGAGAAAVSTTSTTVKVSATYTKASYSATSVSAKTAETAKVEGETVPEITEEEG